MLGTNSADKMLRMGLSKQINDIVDNSPVNPII